MRRLENNPQLKQSKSNPKLRALKIAMFFALLYFVFHVISGERGIIAYFKLQSEINREQTNLLSLRQERLEVENRTKMLRPGSLDLDMLDEKVRSVLGASDKKEEVFSAEHKEDSQALFKKNTK